GKCLSLGKSGRFECDLLARETTLRSLLAREGPGPRVGRGFTTEAQRHREEKRVRRGGARKPSPSLFFSVSLCLCGEPSSRRHFLGRGGAAARKWAQARSSWPASRASTPRAWCSRAWWKAAAASFPSCADACLWAACHSGSGRISQRRRWRSASL